jgi:hypothetical protein
MKRTLIASALVAAIAAPAFANSQLEALVGAEPGVYTTAELVAIKGSFDTDTGYSFPVRDGAVVSTQSTGFSEGHIALAGLLDVNPADFSTAELVAIKGAFDTDTGYALPARGDVVSTQSVGISAGHAQLAAQEGVSPAAYSVGEIMALRAQRDTAND